MPRNLYIVALLSIAVLLLFLIPATGSCQDSSDVTRIGAYSERVFKASGVAVGGNYLYFADHDSGWRVLDATIPADLQLVTTVRTGGRAIDLSYENGYLYVADGYRGLRTYDVSDPPAPLETSWIPTADWAYDISITGERLYLADGDSGVILFDISTPSTPVQLGKCHTCGWAWAIKAIDTICYVADFDSGLGIVNFADPANPQPVGFYRHPGRAVGVTVTGNLCIVADDTEGLVILDISDPSNPALIRQYITAGQAMDVALLDDNYCVVADGWMGIRVLNISNPANPVEVGYYNTDGVATKVVAGDQYVYLADMTNVGIYDCSEALSVQDGTTPLQPSTLTVSPLYPNPFNPEVTVAYNLQTGGLVTLAIMDINGSLLESHSLGRHSAGSYRYNWNGSGYPAGSYLLRLSADGQTVISKAILLK